MSTDTSTQIGTLPPNQKKLDAFQQSLFKSLQYIQQQINELEQKDIWNINLLLMLGPYEFISDTRSNYAQRHTLLLKLRDRLSKLTLLVNQYRNSLSLKPPRRGRKATKSNGVNESIEANLKDPVLIAVNENWHELVDLQKQLAALPDL